MCLLLLRKKVKKLKTDALRAACFDDARQEENGDIALLRQKADADRDEDQLTATWLYGFKRGSQQ